MMFYVLDEHGRPTPEPDAEVWGAWMQYADRVVCQDTIGAHFISTVFLGLDHGWGATAPILWETMIFDPAGNSVEQWRYTSRDDAIAGHAAALAVLWRMVE